MFLHLVFLEIFFLVGDFSYVMDFLIFSIGSLDFSYVVVMDNLSYGFLSFVSLISSSVFMYSFIYMGDNFLRKRFIVLLNLFVCSIFFLVFRPSLISLMLG